MIKKRKILIVIANYYSDISNSLLDSAKKTLIKPFKLRVITVPGVFEMPVIISKNIKKFDAFIALGCVIKGETPHFDFISKASIEAIIKLSVENKKPIGNGIITCLNMKQAIARKNNKGKEAANAVNSVLDELELDDKDMLVDFE
jgi:6,7-dimethyl-8-ribityllumazine synthase|tara:strand:- start:148 stop:582 length:435 start_codon:yes stop_codon:yes gene_type:complete